MWLLIALLAFLAYCTYLWLTDLWQNGGNSSAPSTNSTSYRRPQPVIGNAVQQGSQVHVYDEQGHLLCAFSCMRHSHIANITPTTVSVRTGNDIHVYNCYCKPMRSYNV